MCARTQIECAYVCVYAREVCALEYECVHMFLCMHRKINSLYVCARDHEGVSERKRECVCKTLERCWHFIRGGEKRWLQITVTLIKAFIKLVIAIDLIHD